jgi:hypothetical protein
MRKMTTTSMKKANGGLSCPYCGKFFAFFFGWEKKYDNHVASCKKGNYWLY